MRLISILAAFMFTLSVAGVSAEGQGRGNGPAKKQSAQTTKAKTETPSAKTPHAKTQTAKQSSKAETRAVKAETRAAKSEAKAVRKTGTVATVTPATEVTPTTPTTRPVKNPKLEARLQTMLPPGTTVPDAMAGFKNWGQFVAAVHVSNNLGIPFADLKAKMTGVAPGPTPGTTVLGTPMSLGQAIQSLKGGATPDDGTLTTSRVRNEVKRAEDAANADLRRTRERS